MPASVSTFTKSQLLLPPESTRNGVTCVTCIDGILHTASLSMDARAATTEGLSLCGLVHVSPFGPGFRRVPAPGGVQYFDADDRRISDVDTLERIRRLAIPPAWRDVWIAPDPLAHIQATGFDKAGRK